MSALIEAFRFLTIFKVKGDNTSGSERMSASMTFFPLVGLIIGIILLSVDILLKNLFPACILNILIILILTVLSGGIHIDGFCDTIDGFYAGKNREERLDIMKDSRIGVMAAAGLFFLLTGKYVFLSEISEDMRKAAILIMPVAGRYSMVLSAYLSKPAKDEGLGSLFLAGMNSGYFLGASLIFIILCTVFLGKKGLILISVVFMISIAVTRIIMQKLGGGTGDTLGAVNEITEISSLLTVFLL